MAALCDVEVEPEVRVWLDSLSDRAFGRVDFLVALLAERAETFGELYTRHLDGKVRELRFHVQREQTRVTCWWHRVDASFANRVSQDARRRDRLRSRFRSGVRCRCRWCEG